MAGERPKPGQEKRDRSLAKAAAKMSDADLAEKAKALNPDKAKRTDGEKAVAKAITNEADRRGLKLPGA